MIHKWRWKNKSVQYKGNTTKEQKKNEEEKQKRLKTQMSKQDEVK
jgi:hypothetical protein